MNASLRRGERGSAMVLALLVSVTLTLLGVSFLFMADTENRIAQNEKLAAQALYAAESGARTVKQWFDRPGIAVGFPGAAQVDRSLRAIDLDGPGPLQPSAAGSGELYKDTVDLDGDGSDDLFERPYRGDPAHALLGTEDGPDMRIDDQVFLDQLSDMLLGGYPDGSAGVLARLSGIDIYAPPYIETQPGTWTRYGVATVRVTAQILRLDGDDRQVIAERTVRAVVNEVPYNAAFGPLHSCAELIFEPQLTTHWGAVSARGSVRISDDLATFPAGLPRSSSTSAWSDPLWGADFTAGFDQFTGALPAGTTLDDPWFRLITSGEIDGRPSGVGQPHPSDVAWQTWDGVSGAPASWEDHSNLAQNLFVPCPDFDYGVWKMIASSGERHARYFVWDGGDRFREHGRDGAARTFREITDGQEGVFFFDTADGRPPRDANGDGRIDAADNLTPAIVIEGGSWSFRGMLYVNATSLQFRDVAGVTTAARPPGEPFEDGDGDGRFDAGSESWLELTYPTSVGEPFRVADAGGSVGRDAEGAAINLSASMQGILYSGGRFEASGASRHLGSVIARRGIVQEAGSSGTPEIYWDSRIQTAWPPQTWRLPRVVITRWITDL